MDHADVQLNPHKSTPQFQVDSSSNVDAISQSEYKLRKTKSLCIGSHISRKLKTKHKLEIANVQEIIDKRFGKARATRTIPELADVKLEELNVADNIKFKKNCFSTLCNEAGMIKPLSATLEEIIDFDKIIGKIKKHFGATDIANSDNKKKQQIPTMASNNDKNSKDNKNVKNLVPLALESLQKLEEYESRKQRTYKHAKNDKAAAKESIMNSVNIDKALRELQKVQKHKQKSASAAEATKKPKIKKQQQQETAAEHSILKKPKNKKKLKQETLTNLLPSSWQLNK